MALGRSAGEKQAAEAELSYGLTGKLHVSASGWLLLSVPNALGRGAFDALNEPGVELPLNRSGVYNSHITVMAPDEVKKIGGPDKITERGHEFTYTLGPVRMVVNPDGQGDLSRAYYIEVRSPALEKLRKSYGLSGKPHNGEYDFHCTFAIRKKKVLQENPVAKVASLVHRFEDWLGRDVCVKAGAAELCHVPSLSLPQALAAAGQTQLFGALAKAANSGSAYLNALQTTPFVAGRDVSFLGNVAQHLGTVKARGARTLNEAARWDQIQNTMHPDRSSQRLQTLLSGQRKPEPSHPIDRLLYG